MHETSARRGSSSEFDRAPTVRVRSLGVQALRLSIAAACVGCGDEKSESTPTVEQTPRGGHLWDTEDPGAAAAPWQIVVAGVVVFAFFVAFVLFRRPGPSRPTSSGRSARASPRSPLLRGKSGSARGGPRGR